MAIPQDVKAEIIKYINDAKSGSKVVSSVTAVWTCLRDTTCAARRTRSGVGSLQFWCPSSSTGGRLPEVPSHRMQLHHRGYLDELISKFQSYAHSAGSPQPGGCAPAQPRRSGSERQRGAFIDRRYSCRWFFEGRGWQMRMHQGRCSLMPISETSMTV